MVGFILMKVSSPDHRVRPPNTPTTAAVTTGIHGTRRSIHSANTRASRVTAIKAAVATSRSVAK